MANAAQVPEDFVILRHRWFSEKEDFGLKLTNRTGTIKVGNQDKLNTFSYCYYPSYSVLIDWNGDIFFVLKIGKEEGQWEILCKKIF